MVSSITSATLSLFPSICFLIIKKQIVTETSTNDQYDIDTRYANFQGLPYKSFIYFFTVDMDFSSVAIPNNTKILNKTTIIKYQTRAPLFLFVQSRSILEPDRSNI